VALELHSSPTGDGFAADVASHRHPRVGLTGVLGDRGTAARRARVPGSAASYGFRWKLRDDFDRAWWPQGISTGDHDGVPVVITSWYAQPKRGVEMGSRISVVNLRDPRHPRYHHVLLVEPTTGGSFVPVKVHAGGIVWSGDRLFVAATYGGLREFRLGDILDTRKAGLFGYRYLLPQVASFEPPKPERGAKVRDRIRYSFLSLESRTSDDDLRLITGEYSKGDRGQLARLRLAAGRSAVDEVHVPVIPHMQGATLFERTWFVSASRGDKRGGDLWIGTPDAMVRHEGVLPPGPEDLALWPEHNQLWSVTEFPGKRFVFAMDLAALADLATLKTAG
jgi:hypothetical protein